MSDQHSRAAIGPAIGESFDEVVVPHLGAGYRLLHWLTGKKDESPTTGGGSRAGVKRAWN
jgi:hypothetical protein